MRSTNTSDWLTRDDGAITPVVAAVNASLCSSKIGNTGTHWGNYNTLDQNKDLS